MLVDSVLSLVPVAAEVEAVGSENGGHQLEDGQRHAAGVDLLENLADGLFGSIPQKLDQWEFDSSGIA